jgi:hypothetical protein
MLPAVSFLVKDAGLFLREWKVIKSRKHDEAASVLDSSESTKCCYPRVERVVLVRSNNDGHSQGQGFQLFLVWELNMSERGKWAKLQAPRFKSKGAKGQRGGPSGGSRVARGPKQSLSIRESRMVPQTLAWSRSHNKIISRGWFSGGLPNFWACVPSTKDAMFWPLNTKS